MVRVRVLAVALGKARYSLDLSPCVQVYKWIPANLMLRITLLWSRIPPVGSRTLLYRAPPSRATKLKHRLNSYTLCGVLHTKLLAVCCFRGIPLHCRLTLKVNPSYTPLTTKLLVFNMIPYTLGSQSLFCELQITLEIFGHLLNAIAQSHFFLLLF